MKEHVPGLGCSQMTGKPNRLCPRAQIGLTNPLFSGIKFYFAEHGGWGGWRFG